MRGLKNNIIWLQLFISRTNKPAFETPGHLSQTDISHFPLIRWLKYPSEWAVGTKLTSNMSISQPGDFPAR